MRKFATYVVLVGHMVVLAALGVSAQDYRGRVQGQVVDESQGALPGVTVRLVNDATGVAVERVSDGEGRYLFDFVEPGMYTVTAELQGFKAAALKNVRVQQRGDVTTNLQMAVGGIEETVTVEAPRVSVRFTSAARCSRSIGS